MILVWHGSWRPWINLWLETCRWNPTWTFFVFSDQSPPSGASEVVNVNFKFLDKTALALLLKEKLGHEYTTAAGYKLCDFRPTYGKLFADYLADHTHWGYCDEDLFLGQLDKFFTAEVLAKHDIVTSCRCSIVGQFTLFKNTPFHRDLYLQIPRIQELLRDHGTQIVDETHINNFARTEEQAGRLSVSRRQIQTHDVNSEEWQRWADELEQAEFNRPHGPMLHGPATWCDGQIFNAATGTEFAFFHFGSWKKKWNLPPLPLPPHGIKGWTATAHGLRFLRREGASRWPAVQYNLRCRLLGRWIALERRFSRFKQALRQRKADWYRRREQRNRR